MEFTIGAGQMIKGFDQGTVTVSAINNDDIELDANHELAGKTLTLEVEMIKIS